MYGRYVSWALALLAFYFVSPTGTSQFTWSISDVPSLERTHFKKLLNDPDALARFRTTNDPTMYEQLISIGYNSTLELLEATIEIKLSNGYDGDLCSNGSTEYVGFYIDNGTGWQDIGISTLNIHNILGGKDCTKHRTKPLFYSLSIGFQPHQNSCAIPVLPNIRAILSWQVPPDSALFVPVWGNILDQHIQTLALPPKELLSSYRRDTWERPSRWEYLDRLQSYRNDTEGTLADDNTVHPTYNEDLPRPPGPRVFHEELISLGLDYTFDRLVGTIRIRQPVGYGGGLCSAGGLEYVSFWADWNDTCKWTYLGTQTIPVHNIPEIPPDGLTYSAIQPVDLRWEKALCNTTKVARVLAAVSFDIPPPMPPLVPLRGNFLERHVQLQPISTISTVGGLIESIGGVFVTEIEWKTTGKTSPGATFKDPPFSFTDPLQLGRGSPFGGNIIITGPPIGIGQYYYRVMVRNFGSTSDGSPVTIRQYIDNSGPPKTVTEATPKGIFNTSSIRTRTLTRFLLTGKRTH